MLTNMKDAEQCLPSFFPHPLSSYLHPHSLRLQPAPLSSSPPYGLPYVTASFMLSSSVPRGIRYLVERDLFNWLLSRNTSGFFLQVFAIIGPFIQNLLGWLSFGNQKSGKFQQGHLVHGLLSRLALPRGPGSHPVISVPQ